MKAFTKFLRLFAFLVALLFTTLVLHAQIEVRNPPNPTYIPALLQISREDLILELNNNIKYVTGMVNAGAWKGLTALDDRIETQLGVLFYYKDIANKTIILSLEENTVWVKARRKLIAFIFDENGVAQVFAENLYTIVQHSYQALNLDSLLTVFKPVTEQYRALQVKPSITEEQRKYIVQANLFNQKKEYGKAISLYHKVIEVDQTAYPAAYYNLALLLAQTRRFRPAIYNMKKYLMLVPDAGDARAAKDKIYEWEAELEK